ncbi:hypothetical protein IMSHALPRED_009434 [Imshaugia aleurites]|uniref:Uncharacterized protein n=1 Tax=Imshaugia aleurites TaxID=172621 RepID=A0A8H3G609_9LECA|nr:hypothetical protein IMSHALPRED_009434 [Imshaugia aleurites]
MISLAFLLFVARAARALILPPLNDTSSNTAASSAWLDNASSETPSSSPSPPNASLVSTNVSADVHFTCDACSSNLTSAICRFAALAIEYELTKPSTWGPCGTAITYDFPIPQRWVSSDGTCLVEAYIDPGSTLAIASLQDVTRSASGVIRQGVEQKSPSEGGFATELGGCPSSLLSFLCNWLL